ncbi:hypothetical protein BH11ARM2_BH11ARM2_05780 [soil metagenome]
MQKRLGVGTCCEREDSAPGRAALLISPRRETGGTFLDYRMLEFSEEDHPRNSAALFRLMVLVQAKSVARKTTEAGRGFLEFLDDLHDGASIQKGDALPERTTFASDDPMARINELRHRFKEMTILVPLSRCKRT